jgi:hypothetical protein
MRDSEVDNERERDGGIERCTEREVEGERGR